MIIFRNFSLRAHHDYIQFQFKINWDNASTSTENSTVQQVLSHNDNVDDEVKKVIIISCRIPVMKNKCPRIVPRPYSEFFEL